MTHNNESTRRLGLVLTVAMVIAMLMGPGPGLRLVNPDISDPDAVYVVAGMPIVYVWGVCWFAVQVAIVLVAYLKIWRVEDSLDVKSETEG
ncbi:MAG: hypothetical protein SH809_20125 [Rhodothermales bacterium]|nr:hypothetical protein [Rhodothermales bacterium]